MWRTQRHLRQTGFGGSAGLICGYLGILRGVNLAKLVQHMRSWLTALLLLTTPSLALAAPADEQNQPAPLRLPQQDPDFLFDQPAGSFGVRGGWTWKRADSDWYPFVGEQLTIAEGAFNAPALGIDVSMAVAPRADVVIGLDYSSRAVESEYRDFVDNNRLPISQRTELRSTNITGSLRVALTDRGRQVGRFAWVPRKVVPYVGAGGGVYWFELKQAGDFVDFLDLSVFTDSFESTGWTPSGHVFGGADIALHRRILLTVEARYLWASGDLGADWIDFEPLDLAGLQLSTGIRFPF